MKTLKKVLLILVVINLIAPFSLAPAFGHQSDTHGFRLVNQAYIADIQSTVFQYQHDKSGARLLYINNDDENKVFSINFYTPPTDNTGVNHVIEHCVLDGSRNYPVKSLLTEAGKRSLATFFNAMTGDDFTSYIAASHNDKGFMNLINLYMDAVFYPNVLGDETIFLQEAGHYELASPDEELSYSGVVYNEIMAQKSPVEFLMNKIGQTMFPDSDFQFNSGGEPDEMRKLTYQHLLDTYDIYYHPGNSFIYLYGKMDIEAVLKFLDDSYLSRFNDKTVNPIIKAAQPLNQQGSERIFEYETHDDLSAGNRDYLSWNCAVTLGNNVDAARALNLLSLLVFDQPSTPLRQALTRNGFDNVYFSINGSTPDPMLFTLFCDGTSIGRKDEFEKIIEEALRKTVDKGIDKEDIKALLHSYEVKSFDEAFDSGRGITLLNKLRPVWMYGGDLFGSLNYSLEISILKKAMQENYLERLIQEHLLDNPHKAMVLLKARSAAGDGTGSTSQELQRFKESLLPEQIEAIIKQTRDLKERYSQVGSDEALSKLPQLSTSDLNLHSPGIVEQKIEVVDGLKVMFTPVDTRAMNHISFYFDASVVPQEKIPYLKLLEAFLGKVATEQYEPAELGRQLQASTAGNTFFAVYGFSNISDANRYSPKMMGTVNVLDRDMPAAISLLNQVLVKSKLDNRDEIKYLIHQNRLSIEHQVDSGYSSYLRGRSYISDSDQYNDYLNGLFYYRFVSDLDDNFDQRWPEIEKNLIAVYSLVFNRNGIIMGFVGSAAQYQTYRDCWNNLFDGMNDGIVKPQVYSFPELCRNEGLVISRSVSSVTEGFNYKELGFAYSGKMKVLETVLNEYLYNKVRAQGGAYGARAEISRNGLFILSSGRDPQIKRTLDAFASAPSYIAAFKADRQKMSELITSTVARIDSEGILYSPNKAIQAVIAQQLFLMGETNEALQRERSEVLETTDADIRAMAELVDALVKKNCYCVAGGRDAIEKEKGLFNSIILVKPK